MKSLSKPVNKRLMTYAKFSGDLFCFKKKAIDRVKWALMDGEELRYAYPLTNDSIVFDVGGYQGGWADEIIKRYNPVVHIFEPVDSFYELIVAKHRNNPKVTVNKFGLGGDDRQIKIAIDGDASSIFGSATNQVETVDIVNVANYIRDNDVKKIDLIKINIEGGEYELLDRLIESGLIVGCRNIQVQFHDFIPNANNLRAGLHKALSKTHVKTYCFEYIWENWLRVE